MRILRDLRFWYSLHQAGILQGQRKKALELLIPGSKSLAIYLLNHSKNLN